MRAESQVPQVPQVPQGANDAATQQAQAARVEMARDARQAQVEAELARVRAEMARAQAEQARAAGELTAAQARAELADVRVQRGPDGHTTVTLPDGRVIRIESGDGGAVIADGPPQEFVEHMPPPGFPPREASPDFLRIGLAGALLCAVLALVWYVARATGRRAAPAPAPADLDARLLRIEHAVETIAVEVERVSEAQRFSARLLAERPEAAPRARHHTPGAGSPLS
ncbi:hypothetical protein [Roseisolibacter sp. H3M3-2]|uniref:hypothetical protein n=1 Tax=Roseisolibacter sp. H3M3-2 TaxID=3031323 RepID=UPI0023DC885C|nr:hypothetical protein [Roseisolibacter sp. H3M3-2]MDF1502798.1 hypothetical protein [Roseisolibacter sp. H3M3-2]